MKNHLTIPYKPVHCPTMVLTLAVALALTRLATAHVLGTGVPRLRCGTQAPTEEHLAAAAHFAEQETDEGLGFRAENITVNTYFHVVAPSDREEDGYLSVRGSPYFHTQFRPRRRPEAFGQA